MGNPFALQWPRAFADMEGLTTALLGAGEKVERPPIWVMRQGTYIHLATPRLDVKDDRLTIGRAVDVAQPADTSLSTTRPRATATSSSAAATQRSPRR